MKTMKFLGRYIKKPRTVGALSPSSQKLAKQMVGPLDFANVKTIVEYGTGTGVFTKYIKDKIDPQKTLFFSFEIDQELYKISKEQISDVEIINDSAAAVNDYLKKHGKTHADAVVSGLPWAFFSDELQNEILDQTLEALEDGGYFTTFTYVVAYYMPAARRFRKKLKSRFSEVKLSPVVWKNFPPAVVYWCKK